MKCSGDVFLPRRTSVRDDSNVAVSDMQGQDFAQIVAVVSVNKLAISMDGWALLLSNDVEDGKCISGAHERPRGAGKHIHVVAMIYPYVLALDTSLL